MKILTGDNAVVTGSICRQVGLSVEGVVLGSQIERMTSEQLARTVESTTLFAKLSPGDKKRVRYGAA